MHVLNFEDYQVVPTEECFLIKPIRDLYNKDKTKYKEKFMTQLSVIYFMADPRSTYSYVLNEDERLQMIVEQEGLPTNFTIDKDLQKAIDCYKEHTKTASSLLLESALIAIEKVREFLKNIDLNEVDDKGKPKYTINTITTAIKQLPQLAKDVQEAQKSINNELEEISRARGGNEKLKAFENGI